MKKFAATNLLGYTLHVGLLATLACDSATPADPDAAVIDNAGAGGAVTPAPVAGAGSGATSAAGAGAASAGVSGRVAAGSGGVLNTAGASAAAGSSGSSVGGAGASAGGASGSTNTAGSSGSAGSGNVPTEHFSFFVTSLVALQRLSESEAGFGGDLRFGKADGLSGADEICRQIAETSLEGAGNKPWRAFLSIVKGADGKPVNAIDRVGEGPWYDRRNRLVAMNKANLAQVRPVGADTTIINDLPNEDGVPNHAPDGTTVDNHDMLTGSSATGTLYKNDLSVTCQDWTSAVGSAGKPRVGHSWPRMGGGGGGRGEGGGMNNWMSALDEAGCAPGVSLIEMGPPNPNDPTVGSGGGYGGFYCFSLVP